MKRLALILIVPTFLLAGCVGGLRSPPPKDWPRFPPVAETPLVQVDGTRTANGVELSEQAYTDTLGMIVGLRAERDTLRAQVEEYNRWVAKMKEDNR